MLFIPVLVQHTELMDVFKTEAFSGTWTWLSKLNFVGAFMQAFISITGLLGICLISIQVLCTVVYKSAPGLMDEVYEIKQAGKGGKALGLPNIVKDTLGQANHGTGVDAIVSFVLSLFIDFKRYSYFNPERKAYNLEEDDSIVSVMLKISLPTIMLLFLFSICWNGSLFQAYGNVVNAMAVVGERVVNEDLAQMTERAISNGQGYSFTYSADGTEFGSFKQKIAKDIYGKILRKSDDLSTNAKYYIGTNVDNFINTHCNSLGVDMVGSASVPGFSGEDSDCKNLEYSVVINGTQSFGDVTSGAELGGGGVPVSTFGINGDVGNAYYLHVFISKKSNADEVDYFKVNESDANPQNSGTTNNVNKQDKPTGQQ